MNQNQSATGEQLTAEQAFTTLAYLNLMRFPTLHFHQFSLIQKYLRFPMTMLGVLIPWVLMTRVSLVRFLAKFKKQACFVDSTAQDEQILESRGAPSPGSRKRGGRRDQRH